MQIRFRDAGSHFPQRQHPLRQEQRTGGAEAGQLLNFGFLARPPERQEAQGGVALSKQADQPGVMRQRPAARGLAVRGVQRDEALFRLQACLREQGAREGVLLAREIDARALAVPFDAERAQYAGLAHGGIAVEHVGGMRVQQARIPRRRIGEADRGAGKGHYPPAARKLLEVHDQIIPGAGHMPVPRDFLGQGGQYLFVQCPDLAEMRVVLKERGALFFGQQVDLGVRITPFEQLDGRRGEHHIADLPELADKDALGRKGGEIDGHYSAPTSSAMRRHMDALFSVYRWMPGAPLSSKVRICCTANLRPASRTASAPPLALASSRAR